jgi:cytoskeleton protein RodZ
MAPERPGDFGSRLRGARERKGVSLREIANRTKISVAVLEALERNDITRLPGGIFSRAFVRAYASEVGLDPEAAIQEFVAQFPHDSVVAGHSTADPIEDNVALESDRRMASNVLWMVLVCVPLAGVVLYLSTMNRATPVDMTPAPPVTAPAATAPAPDVKPPAAPAVESSVPPVEATAGSTPPRAATTRSVSDSAPPAPTSMTSSSRSAAPSDAPPAAADRLVVGLSARRTVYVSIVADGRTVLSRLLQPGERTHVDVARELTLTAGDAAALSMTLNGAEARALGKAGEVVSTRVTLANFKDYLQNR